VAICPISTIFSVHTVLAICPISPALAISAILARINKNGVITASYSRPAIAGLRYSTILLGSFIEFIAVIWQAATHEKY
jgi:hypothetical protein